MIWLFNIDSIPTVNFIGQMENISLNEGILILVKYLTNPIW